MSPRLFALTALALSGCFDEDKCAPEDAGLCGGQEGSPDGHGPEEEPKAEFSYDTRGEAAALQGGQGTGGIAGADGWCWVIAPRDGGIAVIEVDLETAAWEEIGLYGEAGYSDLTTESLARFGDALVLHAESGGGTWLQIDLAAGTITNAGSESGQIAVATDGARLLSGRYGSGQAGYYASFEDLVADDPDEVLPDELGANYAIGEGWVYTGTNPSLIFDVRDAATLDSVGQLGVEDLGAVWGIGAAGEQVYLLDDGASAAYSGQGAQILGFHRLSQGPEGRLFLSDIDASKGYTQRPSGLWCEEHEEKATP